MFIYSLDIRSILFWSTDDDIASEKSPISTRTSLIFEIVSQQTIDFEYIFSRALTNMACLWVLGNILAMELEKKRVSSQYQRHRRCAIFGSLLFFLTYIQGPAKICSILCVPIQYCFIVFLTLIILEFAQLERLYRNGRGNPTIVCLAGWVLPAIPTVWSYLIERDTCWLNLGPELAFATMLPLIVITSASVLIMDTTSNSRTPASSHGLFYILTTAWLLYFCSNMITQYPRNTIYAFCFAVCCGCMVKSLRWADQQQRQSAPSDCVSVISGEKRMMVMRL